MAEVVIKTHITPKKLTENIVSRQRLQKKFSDNASKNIILVTAPAGYGKTTAVLEYFAFSGKPYAWFHMPEDISGFSGFINYIIHSLKFLNPDFGEKTLELTASFEDSRLFSGDEQNSVKSVIGTFVNEFISGFPDDVFMVLDDLHNLKNPDWLNIAFNSLIDIFPQNLHLIITTRAVPDFNLARLNAKRKLLKLESRDLNFSHDETGELLKDIYDISFKQSDINLLDKKIEGWITGLHLILQAYGGDFGKITAKSGAADENIFDFFAEDIFNGLNQNTRDFLLSTSMLDTFTPGMCDEILEIKNSNETIDNLKKKNLFIESVETVKSDGSIITVFSYHNLFREFLQAKLQKEGIDITALAEKIFSYYEKSGNVTSAIEFTFRANNFNKAAELLKRNFDTLYKQGVYELLWKWIELFPEDVFSSDTELLFFKGRLVRFFKNDLAASQKIFEEVSGKSGSRDELRIFAKSEISGILSLLGKPEEALSLLKEIYELEKTPGLQVQVIALLAKGYYRMGPKYYDKMINHLNEAEEICKKYDIRENISEIYSLYGKVFLNKGDFSKSLHYFENIISIENNLVKKFHTLNDIVLLYAWTGNYTKAKEYIEKSSGLFGKFNVPLFERDLSRFNALLKFESGDYEDAVDLFSYLISYDKKSRFIAFLPFYYLMICESYQLLNNKEKAKEYFSLAEQSSDPNDKSLKIEFEYYSALLMKMDSENPKIEKTLLSTIKHYESYNSVYNKTQIQFHLSDYYFKTGNPKTALEYLKESLDTASEKQYNSFLCQHFLQKRYLFDFALSENIRKDYITHLYNLVRERNSLEWLSDKRKQRLTAENINLCDIYLSTFGGAEILVRGTLITEEKWIRKKSKLLLVYLLINQGIKIQKDKVLGLFFSELSSVSAENVFHQALSNIRNVLKPVSGFAVKSESKLPKKPKAIKPAAKKEPGIPDISPADISPAYISYEDKILQMNPGYDYKVDVIEFNKLTAAVKSPESADEVKEISAKKAVELYKGEFLPGYYDDWIEELRTVLEQKYIDICGILIEILLKKRDFDDAVIYSEKLLQADKLHEEGFLGVITSYKESGNLTMAKKKFRQLIKNYDEEYGEKPPKDLMNRISLILDTDN